MPAAPTGTLSMEHRRALTVVLALGLGALALGASVPAWLGNFVASAAWFLGAWLAISLAASLIAVRWFRARARANELITPEGQEIELPGEPATK